MSYRGVIVYLLESYEWQLICWSPDECRSAPFDCYEFIHSQSINVWDRYGAILDVDLKIIPGTHPSIEWETVRKLPKMPTLQDSISSNISTLEKAVAGFTKWH